MALMRLSPPFPALRFTLRLMPLLHTSLGSQTAVAPTSVPPPLHLHHPCSRPPQTPSYQASEGPRPLPHATESPIREGSSKDRHRPLKSALRCLDLDARGFSSSSSSSSGEEDQLKPKASLRGRVLHHLRFRADRDHRLPLVSPLPALADRPRAVSSSPPFRDCCYSAACFPPPHPRPLRHP